LGLTYLHQNQEIEKIELFRCKFLMQKKTMIYGYARVSTAAQEESRQVRQLKVAGCESKNIFRRPRPPSSEELASAYKPYIETCIAAFGVDRAMFESNFPPDGASSSYPILWNAFKRLAAGYSSSEKAALFSGTAKRVYRLT
jgi:hypothetical protein